jgi:hypothetical protein
MLKSICVEYLEGVAENSMRLTDSIAWPGFYELRLLRVSVPMSFGSYKL